MGEREAAAGSCGGSLVPRSGVALEEHKVRRFWFHAVVLASVVLWQRAFCLVRRSCDLLLCHKVLAAFEWLCVLRYKSDEAGGRCPPDPPRLRRAFLPLRGAFYQARCARN